MNPVIQAILSRRSVRAFEERPLDPEQLATVAKCGAWAPSALNGQSRHFTVINNPATITRLCRAIEEALGRPGYDMYAPVALIIPSDRKDNRFFKEDLSCAMENMMLAAHAMGIGSVWINQLSDCCDVPGVRELLCELGIPRDHGVLGRCALGYAKAEGIRPPQKTNPIRFAD